MPDAAFLTPPLEIDEGFLDYNGHVNMAFHLVLADRALDLAFAEIKGDRYLEGRGMTTFAAEMHVRYLREIHMGDEIRGRVRWAASDAKRARWAIELVRGPAYDVTTTVEGVSLSVRIDTRKVSPFPNDVVEKLALAVSRDAGGVSGLKWLGRSVALARR